MAKTATQEKPIKNFFEIPLTKTMPSPTQPRKRFLEDKLNELAASIEQHGVLEPVLVRPAKNKAGFYELVFGERRWRASKLAKRITIPAMVVEMTDEQVIEAQITENLQRDDLHPLDEALGFQSLIEKVPNMDVAEISRRIGKSEKYVYQRLKLNSLIDEAKDALSKDILTLGHALELARLSPGDQKKCFEQCFEKSYRTDWKPDISAHGLQTVAKLREYIETKILLKLKSAPFSLKDTRLREDGLACQDCAERTGYNPILFEDIGKEDRCFNRTCFEAKSAALVQIKRDEQTERVRKEKQNDSYETPLISDRYSPEQQGVLGDDRHYKEVDPKKSCEYAEPGIYSEGRRIGQKTLICREPKCKQHWNFRPPAETRNDPAVKGRRTQELFDLRVAEEVRKKVLRLVWDKIRVNDELNAYPLDRSYLNYIAAKIWEQLPYNQHKLMFALLKDVFPTEFPTHNFSAIAVRMETLSAKVLFRLMSLSAFIHLGENPSMTNFINQDEVIVLAEWHKIDYPLLDAQERVKQCPKKHKWDAERYLIEIENGNHTAAKPEVWESPAQKKRLKEKPPVRKAKAEEETDEGEVTSAADVLKKIEAAKNKGELEFINTSYQHLISSNNREWKQDERNKVRRAITAKRKTFEKSSVGRGRKLSSKGGKR